MSRSPATLDLQLHPKQGDALNSLATEALYGGAAGGGKSHLMRVAAILWCSAIPGLQVYLFRRIRDDLVKNHMEGPKGFRAILAGWALCGFATLVEDEIRFWNGAKIYLCHCKDEKDVYKYQGAEIHVLLIDELTHFTDSMYRFLRNRVRMVGVTIPDAYKGRFPRILCGANPGNIGHLWVKQTFVNSAEPMQVTLRPANDGGMVRQFIPARLEDNPSMGQDDPGYENRLEGLGSEALVRAMRWGDWDVVEGAFFDCWDRNRHVVRPFMIPRSWTRFRSGDWGSAKPFAFYWFAVVSDPIKAGDVLLPRGALVVYREWYGCQHGKDNVGLKLTAEEVGVGVHQRQEGDKPTYSVLDPAAFSHDGGPSIAERMNTGDRPADNKRVAGAGAMGGWDQMRSRFKGTEDGPMLVFFSNCLHAIRTIPALQHDQSRPEDLDSDAEDHAADAVRYGCMSRPWAAVGKSEKQRRPLDYAERLDDDDEEEVGDWRTM
ncbi:terminase family protein [Lichenihabitans psoromatis]|uniref:terminase family protein n=1 Tax=Lichenihabitans psoromatis TaxID=2528642 RepID=UPI001035AC6F|nr:terminase family protein [Lichenihabitans psoromatis]